MCGITGFQGNYPRALLEAMTRALAHRGPNGEGIEVFGSHSSMLTGMGHRRLSIIDLSSAGRQPMTALPDAGGRMQSGLTLIFNGEIYNYRELRAELLADGHVFHSETDSEVLLHLYERDGLEMLTKLNGIFAFAIHDDRPDHRPTGVARGALFIARDHIGVKPLYYAESPRGFLFASEIKGIMCDRELSREIDHLALHQTLAYLWTPAPRTMLASVRKLEPGCALLIHEGKVRRHWTYYDLPYAGKVGSFSFDEAARSVASQLETSVTRQLVSDVPVGAYLSGGLDSSAVVAMMRRARPNERITCFTIGFPENVQLEGNQSDLPYARRVARHLNVDLEEVVMEAAEIGRLEEMIYLLDEPQADPAPINALLIAERSRAMGIPVLLSGAGGDDIFSGYRRHWALSFERFWTWLPQPILAAVQRVASAAANGSMGQSHAAIRRLVKTFSHAGEDPDHRLVSYFFWSTQRMRGGLYSPAFAAQIGDADPAEPLLASLARIPAENNRLQRMLYLEGKHFLADHNLNYTDRAGMAVGVEVRVPLLDVDLVKLATQIPASFKQRGRLGKAVFREAMKPFLPNDIIYRSKSGFGAPLRRWLRHELRDVVEDTLNSSSLSKRGFFAPAAVRRLIDADRAGAVDGAYTIFALMCVELWCRRFVDN